MALSLSPLFAPGVLHRKAKLQKDFDPEILPEHLGGSLEEYPPKQPPNMK